MLRKFQKMRKILTWRWGWSVSVSRQDACCLYAVLTDALVTECSLDDDLKTHGMMTMTRDEVSEVRSTLSPDQETGAASASVCCVCQCSAQRSALPSLSLAAPGPGRSRHGPAHLSCSPQCPQVPPCVSWHWPGPASGSRGGHQSLLVRWGHWPCDPDWPLYLVTHTPPTHIEDYQIIINNSYFSNLLFSSPTPRHGIMANDEFYQVL